MEIDEEINQEELLNEIENFVEEDEIEISKEIQYRTDVDYNQLYDLTVMHARIWAKKFDKRFSLDLAHDAYIKILYAIWEKDLTEVRDYNKCISVWVKVIVKNYYLGYFRTKSLLKNGNNKINSYDEIIENSGTIESGSEEQPEFDVFDDNLYGKDLMIALESFRYIDYAVVERNHKEVKFAKYLDVIDDIFRSFILGKETGIQLMKKYNTKLGTIRRIIYYNREYFMLHLKKLYPNKEFPKFEGFKRNHNLKKK